ncbi:NADH-quinone oxidoreductase subunit C [bacterium]|nr:NADH-quinone oxidoreductase subunit C [bacterium]
MESNNLSIKAAEQVLARFPGLSAPEFTYGILAFDVPPALYLDVIDYLSESLGFSVLTTLCGIHFLPGVSSGFTIKEEQIGVVVHLFNMPGKCRIRIRSLTNDVQTPTFPSLTSRYEAANWMEREAYDFFGIQFTGHPNLTRILNETSMTYFPMRKQHVLEDATRTDKNDAMFGR